tara:strand:- start:217 stop:726 length:510 start_codon:yes stop_codon:yes gene_type:complete
MTGILKCDTIQNSAGAFEHARLVQVVNVMDGDVATGTTTMPIDNTIPQNDEGNEVMTLAITPTHASNKLLIEVVVTMSNATSGRNLEVALFQDSTAGALASQFSYMATGGGNHIQKLTHYMTTGTTSSTTFKVRIGSASSGTITFNGYSGAQKHGGVAASSITISEIRE